MFVYLRGNKKQRRAVQKESPFPVVGIGGKMLWRSAAASLAVFDLLERRAQETSRPRSHPACGARDTCDADLKRGRWSVVLYTIAARLHLHAESGRADFSLMFLHVSVSVC